MVINSFASVFITLEGSLFILKNLDGSSRMEFTLSRLSLSRITNVDDLSAFLTIMLGLDMTTVRYQSVRAQDNITFMTGYLQVFDIIVKFFEYYDRGLYIYLI